MVVKGGDAMNKEGKVFVTSIREFSGIMGGPRWAGDLSSRTQIL